MKSSTVKNSALTVHRFDLIEEAQSLKSVAFDTVQTSHTKVKTEWFHSQKSLDVFIWQDPHNKMIKFQMGWLGQIVEWNPLDGLKTGVIVEIESQGQQRWVQETLRYDHEPSVELVNECLEIIEAFPAALESRQGVLREPLQVYLERIKPWAFFDFLKKMMR